MRRAIHYTRFEPAVAAIAVILGAVASSGCFQEVHYTGPIDAAAGVSITQTAGEFAELGGGASDFGDELVVALATEPIASGKQEQTATLHARMPAGPLSTDGRYEPTDENLGAELNQGFLGAAYSSSEPRRVAAGAEPPIGIPSPAPLDSDQALQPAAGSLAVNTSVAGDYQAKLPTAPSTIAGSAASAESSPPWSPDAEQPRESAKTRRAAFLLGSKWSVAALSRDRGAAQNDVEKWFSQARALAHFLGTSVNQMPPATSELQTTTVVLINYLVNDGKRIGRDLVEKHGADHAALFELGVKSNMLMVLYEPRTPLTETLTSSMVTARELAGSPVDVWRPLFDAVSEGRDPASVRRIVLSVHDSVDASLAKAMEQ